MNTTTAPFSVGDYATIAQIDEAIREHETSKPLGEQTYGRTAAACSLLQGEDAQWAIGTHCRAYAFPLTPAVDFYSVLIYGDETAPFQVWGSTKVAPSIHSEWERLA